MHKWELHRRIDLMLNVWYCGRCHLQATMDIPPSQFIGENCDERILRQKTHASHKWKLIFSGTWECQRCRAVFSGLNRYTISCEEQIVLNVISE